ncbi:anticodon-binding aminoacyl-tRNA synthetase, class 1a [Tanacetum coccineum]
MRLQAEQEAEHAELIHLDHLLAQRMQEEEEMTEQQKKRQAEVLESAKYYTKEDWDIIRANVESNAELSKILLGENENEPGEDFATRMVNLLNQRKNFFAEQRVQARKNRPMTQTQQRTYMSNYLKHQGSWTSAQLKKLSDEEIKAKYERLVRSIANFVPMGAEERVKRLGPELQSDTSKKQKTTEVKEVPVIEEPVKEPTAPKQEEIEQPIKKKRKLGQSTAKEDEEYEKEKEELSMFLIIAFDEHKEVDYEILDQRSPIIAWNSEYYGPKPLHDEVEVPEEINMNVVTRLNGSKRYFSVLFRVLSIFDRDDLSALYQLVIDKYQDEIPKGFDLILWGDLTTMFHPNEEDDFWKSQEKWNIVSWKLHKSSGVHTLKTDTEMVIHMLVEKKYPLMKKVLLQMLELKLESEDDTDFPAPPTDSEYLRSGMRYMIHNEVVCLMLGSMTPHSGLRACILQHECDHLEGILYVDKIVKKTFVRTKHKMLPPKGRTRQGVR